jgi:hypothetical protein
MSAVRANPLKVLAEHTGLLPTQKILREVEKHLRETGSPPLSERRGFDPYAGDGDHLSRFLGGKLASVEAWEIDAACEARLRRNVPDAEIKIGDSHQMIKDVPPGSFDFAMVDNSVVPSEHFPLFPHLYASLSDDAIVVMNVLTWAGPVTRWVMPKQIFHEEHRVERRRFYDLSNRHTSRLTMRELVDHYTEEANRVAGLATVWHYCARRFETKRKFPFPVNIYMLALHLQRVR